jgi:5'-3' exonuclease
LFVDINNLIYRSAYKLRLSNRAGKNTGAVFGTLKMLGHLADAFGPEEMIICWDGSDAVRRRRELYPDYKQNRQRDPEFVADLQRQRGVLRHILSFLPVVQVDVPGVEADDAVAVLAAFCHLEQIGIVTSDRDLYCLAGRRCRIIEPGGRDAKLELEPSQYIPYKVLVGDSSDNVKGVDGIGDVRARALLTEYGTLDSVLRFAEEQGRLGRMQFAEVCTVIDRNLRLLTPGLLLTSSERKTVVEQYARGRLARATDVPGLRAALLREGFVSIVSRLTGWLMPFRKMERGTRRGRVDAEAQAKTASEVRAESGTRSAHRPRSRDGEGWVRVVRAVEASARIIRATVEGEVKPRGGVVAAAASRLVAIRNAEAAVGVAATGRHTGAEGAVRAGRVRQAGSAGAARDRGAGGDPAPVFQDAGVLRQRRERARSALSVLPLYRGGDRWEWLRRQPSRRLQEVVRLIEHVCVGGAKLSKQEVAFVEDLEHRYTVALPEWMQTDKEKEDAEKNEDRNRRLHARSHRDGAKNAHRAAPRKPG